MKKTLLSIITSALCAAMLLSFTSCGVSVSAEEKTPASVAASEKSGSATGKKVYFAAPLFSEAEREYNLMLAELLEEYGYEVFLPQRDGLLATELEGKTGEEIFDYKEGAQRERRYLNYTWGKENHIEEFYQTGFAADWSNMVPTGNVYDYQGDNTEK